MQDGDRAARLAADAEARRLAQRQFDRPLVLEAGAGTGKTTTLVARVLSWCLGPGWEAAEARLEESRGSLGALGSEERRPEPERLAARVLRGVVAITFTEAAAAEMAGRVGEELSRLAGGGELPVWLEGPDGDRPRRVPSLWRQRARALLATLDHLTVQTIHAWCLKLLGDFPLDADLHPRLTVDAEGRRLPEIVREVVEARLAEAYGGPAGEGEGKSGREVYLEMAARGVGPAEIARALEVLVREGVRPRHLEPDPGTPEMCDTLAAETLEAARALEAVAGPTFEGGQGRLDKALEVVAAVRGLVTRLEELPANPSPARLARALEALPEGVAAELAEWSRGDFTKTEERCLEDPERLSALAADLHPRVLHGAELELLSLAHRALLPLLVRAREEMRSRGLVTFQDLLEGAAELLEARPGVAARLRRRLDQVLVDEFQDTDALQCRILRTVALEGPEEERPGLFLVGDPKQSIYGWRNADLAAYEAFVASVEAAGGERRSLVQSFRSLPAVLDEVTRVVEPVMVEEEGLQPRFEALLASDAHAGAPPYSAGGRHSAEHWVSWRREGAGGEGPRSGPGGPDTVGDDADLVEAAAIARDLADLHRRHGLAWGDAALVFRSTTALEPYLEALRRAGVPFQVRGDRQYYRRREVIDAAALVRSVLDPGDHLALLTLLRSPLVGVPDAALLPLWRQGLPRRVTDLAAVPEEIPGRLRELKEAIGRAAAEMAEAPVGTIPGLDRLAGWPEALLAALEHLAAARVSARTRPSDVFVDDLRMLFLPELLESARYLGAYRLANLERFFRTLAEGLEEGGDTGAVLRLLRQSVAQAREMPESPSREGAEDAVQVLTIHGAKGLEFDHVYLPQLHRGSGGFPAADRTEVLRSGDRVGLRLFGAALPEVAQLEVRARRVEELERVRLLYVAVTRAKRRVVMAGQRRPRRTGPGTPMVALLAERRESPEDLEALWARALEAVEGGEVQRGEAAAGAATPPATPPPSHTDEAGALWRFPALEAPGAGSDEGGEEGAEAGEGDGAGGTRDLRRRLELDAGTLSRRRAAARARRERPFAAAASSEAHRRLEGLLEERPEGPDESAAGAPDPAQRKVGMEVGTALHLGLEELELECLAAGGGEEAAELERLEERVMAALELRLAAGHLEEGRRRAGELLERFGAGDLPGRLAALAGSVLARELPVLLPGADGEGEEDEAGEGWNAGAVGFVAGAVDLLYRDPEDGEVVVADYKTDAVETDEAIARRVAAYAPQGEIYRRAVREALGLERPPRFELWFLYPGRVVTV